jgi:hypothetical protein
MLTCRLMRLSRQIAAQALVVLALVVLASPVLAETAPPPIAADIDRQDPDIDVYALMSGNCPTLKIDGTKFTCKTMGFFHGMHGRVSFTVVLDDPADENHIVSFSGPGSRQASANFYYLSVDRLFLNSKDRPKEDGVPVPLPVASTGSCKQIGSLVLRQITSIACNATDGHGKTFELQFQSDSSPILVRRIKQAPVDSQDPFAKE